MIQKSKAFLSTEFLDPRYFQILFLSSFLLFGISFLGWETNLSFYIAVLTSAVITQIICVFFTTKNYTSIKSALITALGLCLLLKVGHNSIAVFASIIAILSKFLIRIKNKHIFNPANIGIVATIFLTQQAWVSPGQWGSSTLLLFFIGSAGLMMILKVGRLDTAFTFLITFGLLLFCRQVLYLGWEPSVWIHKMSNGTLLLFTFFMITDPMTTPNHKKARIYWAIGLAVALFIASNYFYIQTAAIWLLFFISPITVLFDKILVFQKFSWTQKPVRKLTQLNTK